MSRRGIETIKAVACAVMAVVSLVLLFVTHQFMMALVTILLAVAAGWFWWKASYFTKNPPDSRQ
ncbi:hypothetical protein GMA10_08835 [Kocuria koreensis]|jgi:hypothetical protein|uniref:Uncharacterized protein n=1 Tax=Rothia koreensis TaxID=592378 RepID=A0A7K1LJM5_9MICC|nr:hypothetical protein [Rothia koreensis]MUN55310.1 hypothetical protein [Rothia koreensis]